MISQLRLLRFPPSSGHYVDGNVSLRLVPSNGWFVNTQMNLSVVHTSSSNPLFNGTINSSTSQKSFFNLSEGGLWVNATVCDALNRCST